MKSRVAAVLAAALSIAACGLAPQAAGPSQAAGPAREPARTGVIWSVDPTQGTQTFARVNCDAPGTISVVSDPDHGAAWQYHKPAGDKRCESHGIALGGRKYVFHNNATYYIGWWSKLSTVAADDFANFQWKSYGKGMTRNYPFVLNVLHGQAAIFQHQPGQQGQTVWRSAPIAANRWNHYVIGIHTSDELTGGWIQVWFNGIPQTFTGGSNRYPCRTWDVSNDPKWGVYGATGTDFTNTIAGQKVGDGYDDVAN